MEQWKEIGLASCAPESAESSAVQTSVQVVPDREERRQPPAGSSI